MGWGQRGNRPSLQGIICQGPESTAEAVGKQVRVGYGRYHQICTLEIFSVWRTNYQGPACELEKDQCGIYHNPDGL